MAEEIGIKICKSEHNVGFRTFSDVDAFCEFMKNYIEEWAFKPTVLHPDHIKIETNVSTITIYFPPDLFHEVESIHNDFLLEILPS